ncbi:hypothetical protein [Streptomyces chartreusis]
MRAAPGSAERAAPPPRPWTGVQTVVRIYHPDTSTLIRQRSR